MDFVSLHLTLSFLILSFFNYYYLPKLTLLAHYSLKYLEELFWNETHLCWIEQMAGYA